MKGSIRQRGTTFTALWSTDDPATGKRRQHSQGGFRTKGAAQKHLNSVLPKVDLGTYRTPSTMTLARFLEDKWLPAIRAELAPNTVSLYTSSVSNYVVPRIGGTQLRALTPSDLLAFYASLAMDGRKRNGAGLSARSVQLVHVCLRKALAAAVDWELIPRNPADKARPPRPKRHVMSPWSAGEVRAFIASEAEGRLGPLWTLIATTGMRRGEALGLRWSDVDLDAGSINITRARIVVDYQVSVSDPKTPQSRREIALDAATIATLRTHRARQAAERLAAGEAYETDSDLLFVNELGHPYHPQHITRLFQKASARAGLPVLRLHDLRHSYATASLEAGVELATVSRRLGHASLAVTADIYAHHTQVTDRRAADAVASYILEGTR